MGSSKKVVLFIVEGITDKISLEKVLSGLNNDDRVLFKVIEGDITTDRYTTPNNVAARLGNIVRHFEKGLRKSDYSSIVHIVDTDGAFIADDRIFEKNAGGAVYYEDRILACKKSNIPGRNAGKREILRKLISLKHVWKDIPYRVYFFSCNLDHVLHGDANLGRDEKFTRAEEFEKRYGDDIEGFVEFVGAHGVPSDIEYIKSWEFIEEEENSLKRFTNFNLYLGRVHTIRNAQILE